MEDLHMGSKATENTYEVVLKNKQKHWKHKKIGVRISTVYENFINDTKKFKYVAFHLSLGCLV